MPKPKPHSGKWVSDSGLELEAQRKTVADYLNGGKWTLAAEFVEIESGKRSDNRPQLAAALAACKKQRAKLVVAKLDRLSRNMAFIATMMDSGVAPIIREIKATGATSLRAVAAALTARGIATARGGEWNAAQVANVLKRERLNNNHNNEGEAS